jgi:tRNA A37 threonylcarbamoyladenosine synthetase subunit TsaC/SUA5/YrdC
MRLPGEELPQNDPLEIRRRLQRQVDLVIDGGPCTLESTSVLDLVDKDPRVIREGKGDLSWLR